MREKGDKWEKSFLDKLRAPLDIIEVPHMSGIM